ncbi:MAG TPA: imidazole glycerol phosphate synthase subunit HisH [Thermomicrobiaceae bacterium]|nr:imidazole glycerol phosphate synthase subunit HisH [Thermomicrobiaceae bacterium]
MIAVVDYGAGNLASVVNALDRVGASTTVTQDRDTILSARGVIVPGVGAAEDTMRHLDGLGLSPVIREVIARDTPYLGICMGMQALMTISYEGGAYPGLDVISGAVRRLPGGQPVPHMGWNQVRRTVESALFDGIPDAADFYFVHSYYVDPDDPTWTGGLTDYGIPFTSAVVRGNVMGTQFHPEKSGRWGLRLLANFARIVATAPAPIGAGAC